MQTESKYYFIHFIDSDHVSEPIEDSLSLNGEGSLYIGEGFYYSGCEHEPNTFLKKEDAKKALDLIHKALHLNMHGSLVLKRSEAGA